MNFTKPLTALALLAATITSGHAQTVDVPEGVYKIDKTHANLLWSVTHFGLSNYIGRFNDIDATLVLDPQDITKSKLSVIIDPASVDTNYPATPNIFNEELTSEKFFNTAKFDKITFTSTVIKMTGDKTGEVTGDLTFHGVTKPVTLNVTFNGALNPHPMSKKPVVGFSAQSTLKRSDFGVNTLAGPIGDEVSLTIETEFVQN